MSGLNRGLGPHLIAPWFHVTPSLVVSLLLSLQRINHRNLTTYYFLSGPMY